MGSPKYLFITFCKYGRKFVLSETKQTADKLDLNWNLNAAETEPILYN